MSFSSENNLFDNDDKKQEPLAARMRPRTLDEYIGQDHIVGKGRLLRRAIAADRLTSVIFYGPPGSGKTTLARVIANHTSSNFITLNAVLTGVADIRKSISEAEEARRLYGRKTILFVDEVHRWNKSQQDALLPWVENGTIILIGATTENPFFEVNKALVSRSRVFQLKPLTQLDLKKAAFQALQDVERGYGHWNVSFEKGALEHLIQTANGDARSLLNALELAVETTPQEWNPNGNPPKPSYGSTIYISQEVAEESIQKKVVLYDRDGDYHYDIISAFIKSLRGRDPDAACYWLARMVKAGEDPDFIFRRMLISACEDTGLADPQAICIVQNCAAAFDRVGLPEGRYFLAHAALYLATAPKSNSSMAFFDALSAVEKEDAEVPNHLKDASRDAEGFGHGAGYLYPHAYRDHWVSQQYLPDALVGRVFYTPTTQGYEKQIREDVLTRRETQIAALLEQDSDENNLKSPESLESRLGSWWKKSGHFNGFSKTEENLTFSPKDSNKNYTLDKAEQAWKKRLSSNRADFLSEIRDAMEKAAELKRHHRCLVWNADDVLLIFDILRKIPEGLMCGVCRSKNGKLLLEQYAQTLQEIDKPLLSILQKDGNAFLNGEFRKQAESFGDIEFDRIFVRDSIASLKDIQAFFSCLQNAWNGKENPNRDIAFSENDELQKDEKPIFDSNAVVILSQRIPKRAQHISEFIKDENSEIYLKMEKAESEFFGDTKNPLFAWDSQTIQEAAKPYGIFVTKIDENFFENRIISENELKKWFDKENSEYAKKLLSLLTEEELSKVIKILQKKAEKGTFKWKTSISFFHIQKQPLQD